MLEYGLSSDPYFPVSEQEGCLLIPKIQVREKPYSDMFYAAQSMLVYDLS